MGRPALLPRAHSAPEEEGLESSEQGRGVHRRRSLTSTARSLDAPGADRSDDARPSGEEADETTARDRLRSARKDGAPPVTLRARDFPSLNLVQQPSFLYRSVLSAGAAESDEDSEEEGGTEVEDDRPPVTLGARDFPSLNLVQQPSFLYRSVLSVGAAESDEDSEEGGGTEVEDDSAAKEERARLRAKAQRTSRDGGASYEEGQYAVAAACFRDAYTTLLVLAEKAGAGPVEKWTDRINLVSFRGRVRKRAHAIRLLLSGRALR